MSADWAALKHATACLYRNSDRCVIPDEHHTVYPVNKTKGQCRILLQVPSSKTPLILEKHLCGGPDLAKWDALAKDGNTVVWLTPKKGKGFGVLVNNILYQRMNCLKDVPIIEDEDVLPEKVPMRSSFYSIGWYWSLMERWAVIETLWPGHLDGRPAAKTHVFNLFITFAQMLRSFKQHSQTTRNNRKHIG